MNEQRGLWTLAVDGPAVVQPAVAQAAVVQTAAVPSFILAQL
jgi:hypothetical protein